MATRSQPTPLASRLEVLAAAALFSSGGAVIKSIHLAGWQVACFRSAVAAATLFLILPEARRRPTPKVLGVGLAYAVTLILFVLANKLTTSASAIYLQSTAPLYVLLLSPWLLRERIRGRGRGLHVGAGGAASGSSSWGSTRSRPPPPTRSSATSWRPPRGSPGR